jgi:hypothetical protein
MAECDTEDQVMSKKKKHSPVAKRKAAAPKVLKGAKAKLTVKKVNEMQWPDGLKPNWVMTPKEYEKTRFIGWHRVCRDVDGMGNVGVMMGSGKPGSDDPRYPSDAVLMNLAVLCTLFQSYALHGRSFDWNAAAILLQKKDITEWIAKWRALANQNQNKLEWIEF